MINVQPTGLAPHPSSSGSATKENSANSEAPTGRRVYVLREPEAAEERLTDRIRSAGNGVLHGAASTHVSGNRWRRAQY